MKNTMKKFLWSLIVVVMFLTVAPLSGFLELELPQIAFDNIFVSKAAAASSGTCGENLTWTLDDEGNLTISGTGDMTNRAFSLNDSIKTVVIESGVTSIGDSAFSSCSNLSSIRISNGCVAIGDGAFSSCAMLTSIELPDSVTSIGDSVFNNCSALISIKIPSKVTSIKEWAFRNCCSLVTIDIPHGVTFIGEYAFANCSSLAHIDLPATVNDIGNGAFNDCRTLTSISIPDGVTSIGDGVFEGCSVLFSVELPNGLTAIGDSAFYYCSALESIDIPDSLVSIGDHAFRKCSSLSSVKLSKNLLTIGFAAFYYCESLCEIIIPAGVTVIPEYAFSDCYQLVEVDFFENSQLVMISSCAFQGCNIVEIEIPAKVQKIENAAFSSCGNLTNVFFADNSELVSIDEWAFGGCTKLSYIEIPKTLRNIGPSAFFNVTNVDVEIDDLSAWCEITFHDYMYWWNLYHNGTLVESLYIPDDVESISDYAFYSCASLTEIKASDNGELISIGEASFSACDSLQKVYIPKNVKYISDDAFSVCDNLTDVVFSENSELVSIGDDAFSNSWLLNQIILPASVTSIGKYAFSQTSLSEGFFIPSDSKLEYIGDLAFVYTGMPSIDIPGSLKELGKNPFCSCLRMKQISVNVDNENYCSVDGVLYNKDMTELICYPGDKTGATYIIPASVTRIQYGAFMWNENIQFVSFEENSKLEKLECDSFSCCTNLVSITLPETLTFIDDFSFFQCFDLSDVFFMGSQEQWNNIEIVGQDWGNYWLMSADIHFNSNCHHLSIVYLEPREATCTKEGLTAGISCASCGFVFLEQKTIDMLPHTETIINQVSPSYSANGYSGDIVCSVCGELLEKGYEIPALICDHLCHQSGILGFFWKIIRFFWKLFGMNPVCECGVAHY